MPVLPLHVHVLHLSALLVGVNNLREVSLPSDLLCVQLRRSLVLLVLRRVFRELVEASTRGTKNLRRAK